MLSEIILYLIGILGLVAGILLVERLVAGPRSTAGTGYASVDSAFDYERLLRRQTRARMTGLLRRRDGGAFPCSRRRPRRPDTSATPAKS